MALTNPKGVVFLLLLLLSLTLVSGGDVELRVLIDRQEEHLDKLRGLVETLSGAVSRLESAVSDVLSSRSIEPKSVPVLSSEDGDSGVENKGISVRKSKPLWLERFQLMAEVRLKAEATCAVILPYVDVVGVSKYFALGDARGRVTVFSSAGDELIESETPSGSLVTTMLAYMSPRRNESFLFTGHADGSVVARKVWESADGSEDWLGPVMGSPRVFFGGAKDGELELLEVLLVGRVRYLMCVYGGGTIRVFTENGTLFGVATVLGKPLAFMKQRNFFLTEKGAGWLDLRRMVVLESGCDGWNGSLAKSYAFDVSERSKAYGFTSEGSLIHVMLLGDGVNFKCRVRAIKNSEVDGHVSLLTLKGYLIAVNHERVFVFNISSQPYSRIGVARPMFVSTLAEVRSLFEKSDDQNNGHVVKKPLIAGDRGKLIVLGLGGRYVGIYRPNLPVAKVQSSIVLWSSPALLFFLFLLAMWYIYAKKRVSLVWIPDESFVGSSATAAATTNLRGSVGSLRSFVDPQRTGDLRDVRGSVLRGPTRRYASPSSCFPSGVAAIPYRQNPADPGFTGGAELKYRGNQAGESDVFPLRGEQIIPSNQNLDDHMD